MKYNSIEELVDSEFKHFKPDRAFLTKLEKYITTWKYKSTSGDNSEFLGSNLIGVHRLVFSRYDDIDFFKTFLYASPTSIQEAFYNLEGINSSWEVSSNGLYLSVIVMMHLVYKRNLSKKLEQEIIYNLFMIFAFKCFGSMYNHFFKYQADEAVAKATFEALNNKYIIKREGSWQGVFDHRAQDVLLGGIFEDRIRNLTVNDLVDVVTGIHTRFKDMLKNLFEIYLETKEREEKIASQNKYTSTGSTDENIEEFKEITNLQTKYTSYLKYVINIPNDLVSEELIHLVYSLVPSCKEKDLTEVLNALTSTDYPTDPENDYIEKIVISTLAYLTTKGITHDYHKQIGRCLKYLKGYWMSGTMKDPIAREAKAMSNEVVGVLLETNNKSKIPSVAVGFNIYLFLLAVKRLHE